MTRQSQIGRADLVAVLDVQPSDCERQKAALLGYDYKQPAPPQIEGVSKIGGKIAEPVTFEVSQQPLVDTPFYVAASMRGIERREPSRTFVPTPVYAGWRNRPHVDQRDWRPLADLPALVRDLRKQLSPLIESRELDVTRTVARLAEGSHFSRLPGLARRRSPNRLQVVWDRAVHLMPYWQDQEVISIAVQASLPNAEIEYVVREATSGCFYVHSGDDIRKIEIDDLAGPLLVLGDLGALGDYPEREADFWSRIGAALGRGRAIALSPLCPSMYPGELRDQWTILPWDQNRAEVQLSLETLRADAQKLLTILSPAVRLEPGLVRDVRLAVMSEAPASVEALLWGHAAVAHRSSVAGTLDPKAARELRARFDQEPMADRQRALMIIRQWRRDYEYVWYEEIINLSKDSQALIDAEDMEDARRLFATIQSVQTSTDHGGEQENKRAWLSRVGLRAQTETAWQDEAFRNAVAPIMMRNPDFVPEFSPAELAPTSHSVSKVNISQQADRVQVGLACPAVGSPLAVVASDNGLIEIVPLAETPSWASRSGTDQYGKWAEIVVEHVTQRLRWIPPGRFLMGSPDDEEGRDDDEGPQTEVTIGEGYWLFDTAVTQGLWSAVMGDSSSHFKGDDLPVEQVSFYDSDTFIKRLAALFPELELRLPSEAQWEYACRAGTTTRYTFSDEALPDQIHFDAEATIAVKAKPPNAWGLYQMHGNVWEWCADFGHDSHEGADASGAPRQSHSQPAGGSRVIRGGSWVSYARGVRAACRGVLSPLSLDYNIGFRCAAGQLGPESPAAEPQFRRGAASSSPPPDTAGVVERGRVSIERPQTSLTLPQAPFIIRTDRAELEVARLTRSDIGWASGLGRDRFGLWAELAVDAVTQRLRWIPPGQFMMGSPEDEPGRYGDEGPQTEVTIGQGYWLFDTPVTQALWQAVMGGNPSHFVSAERPVEQVSWKDADKFIGTMNDRFVALGLYLPSEAQWEYACRAGTSDATYAGPIEILGANNAPILDAIAWYCGNSGVDFDHAEGQDSSGWSEKQYPHSQAGTRIVKQKRPNAYGLYDVLGNVWEWCADIWRDSHEDADPSGVPRQSDSQTGELRRVVRGGSWDDHARNVRAAFRSRYVPDDADYFLGFRCAAGQSGPEAQAVAFGPDGREAEPRQADPKASARQRAQKRTS